MLALTAQLLHLMTDDIVSIIPFNFMKVENSFDMNWGPLSVTTCFSKPYVAKCFLSSDIVLAVDVSVISRISGHLYRMSV